MIDNLKRLDIIRSWKEIIGGQLKRSEKNEVKGGSTDMREFDFYASASLDETLKFISEHKDEAQMIAGGTDIMIELNERHISLGVMVDLKKLTELNYIRLENDELHIGALTSHATIAADEFIEKHVKILHTACSQVGSPQIRNLGTIGGNLVSSSVAGDGLCALVTLEASVVLKSVRGVRVMSLPEFFAGEGYDKRNALEADEILVETFFKIPDERTATSFYKLAKRKSLAISVIGGGMLIAVDENGICTRAVMRGGCLGRYPLPFEEAENYLIGHKLTLERMMDTLQILHDKVYEINKARVWSVFYKKEGVKGVFHKLILDVAEQLKIS